MSKQDYDSSCWHKTKHKPNAASDSFGLVGISYLFMSVFSVEMITLHPLANSSQIQILEEKKTTLVTT